MWCCWGSYFWCCCLEDKKEVPRMDSGCFTVRERCLWSEGIKSLLQLDRFVKYLLAHDTEMYQRLWQGKKSFKCLNKRFTISQDQDQAGCCGWVLPSGFTVLSVSLWRNLRHGGEGEHFLWPLTDGKSTERSFCRWMSGSTDVERYLFGLKEE